MKKALPILSIILLSLSGCEYITHLNDMGGIDSLSVVLAPTHDIEIAAPCKLILVNPTSDERLKAIGCDYILEGYTFNSKNGKLTINHPNSDFIQKEKMATILVNANAELNITANAPCVITSERDTLLMDKLTIVVNGRATYSETDLTLKCRQLGLTNYGRASQTTHKLTGAATSLYLHTEGCSHVKAQELVAQNVWADHQSVADCSVWANTSLTVTFSSSGRVYYKGAPSITVYKRQVPFMNATGNVYPLGE